MPRKPKKDKAELRYKVRCIDPGCARAAHVSAKSHPALATGGTVACCHKRRGGQCFGRMGRIPRTQAVPSGSASLKAYPAYEYVLARTTRPRRGATEPDYEEEMLDSEDEAELEEMARIEEIEDPGFEPPVEFRPEMRYSTSMVARVIGALHNVTKSIGPVQIGAKDEAERRKQTKGEFLNVPAWKFALNAGAPNAGRWARGSQNHYEYCHLQGCALGGRTVRANLVAGHYALNTYMMVIEGVLQAKTNLWIEVKVHCVHHDVADALEYIVHEQTVRGLVRRWGCIIDGRITGFDANDALQVKNAMAHAGIR